MRLLRILVLTCLPCLAALQTIAADNEKKVPSSVTAVKVFLQGAQVERTAKATVDAGQGTIVFTGLPQDLDARSLQVSGKGAFNILSVGSRINYLTESPDKKEVEDLQARIKAKEMEQATEANTKAVWDQEEQLLLKNTAIAGQQNGVTATQLQAVNDYVRGRLAAIKAGQLTQTGKINGLNEELAKLRQQLGQLQAKAPRPTGEVVLETDATAAAPASFTITYFVQQASWKPGYDLRATGPGKPIALTMKAQLFNSTGEDWGKVDLALSSGNPTLGGVMPSLYPWVLNQAFRLDEQPEREMNMAKSAVSRNESLSEVFAADASQLLPNTMQQRSTTMEFSISRPFSIPSDGLAHSVVVQELAVPATYQYYCTPKLDRDAFLYARTTGWEDLGLLPGEANVFFEGTYVGKSYLAMDRPQDTLDISLGRDKGITVERVKRKATNDKSLLGGKRTVSIGWDITVRNTKAVPVNLELRDQYPLSPRSETEVKLTDQGGAQAQGQNGLLTWKFTLAPKETKKVGFGYTVKYPKDLPVALE